jgi:hypothetical protein
MRYESRIQSHAVDLDTPVAGDAPDARFVRLGVWESVKLGLCNRRSFVTCLVRKFGVPVLDSRSNVSILLTVV